jgi:hypothetical protein
MPGSTPIALKKVQLDSLAVYANIRWEIGTTATQQHKVCEKAAWQLTPCMNNTFDT